MVPRSQQNGVLVYGPRNGMGGRARYCAATRELKPIDQMIRFVVAPDGAVVADLRRRLPGRGLWITATRSALAHAVERQLFARALHRDIRVSTVLVDTTERLLQRAALDALAVAYKARKVVIGIGQVISAIARGAVVALLEATDAAESASRKLAAALQHRESARQSRLVRSFSAAELGLALGRADVVHAALLAGPESETFLARTARLDCFRGEPVSGSTGATDGGAAPGMGNGLDLNG